MKAALAVASLCASFAMLAPARADGLSEGVVVVVGSGSRARPILFSDVWLVARVQAERRGLPWSRDLLVAALDHIVGETLIAAEAERLDSIEPTPELLERAATSLDQSLGGPGAMQRLGEAWGVSREEWQAFVARSVIVERFLGANLDGVSDVTEADLQAAYAAGGHPFEDQPLDAVREPLRHLLAVQRSQAAVARWLEVLRQRTRVRTLRSLDQFAE